MSWEKVKLIDCCVSIADGDHQPPPKSETGIPFVTIANIVNNQFDFTNSMFVPNYYYEKLDSKRKAQKGDILYSVVGSFGIPVFIKDNKPFVFQRHIAILRPNGNIDARFLYYTMLSRDFYMKADAAAIGAAQRTVSLTALRNIEITVPPIETQRRIADIVSAYDDLIENNRKQIKLLEEAAQRLYKEWFVDLRFPGHEHTKIVDDVPEGWEECYLSKIAEFKRGKTITKAQIEPGIVPVVAGGLGPAYYHNVANTKAPVITVSGSGANAGFTRMYYTDVFASDCSFVDEGSCAFLPFVYCFLVSCKFELESLQKGSAQPHVYAKDINTLHVRIPNDDLLHRFCELADSLFSKIGLLEKQNNNLTQARDRLLPKLMSGEVEV